MTTLCVCVCVCVNMEKRSITNIHRVDFIK